MDVDEMAERLNASVAHFAALTGVSRATLNTWRAKEGATYRATPDPDTLERMAAQLAEHRVKVGSVIRDLRRESRRLARERGAAGERAPRSPSPAGRPAAGGTMGSGV